MFWKVLRNTLFFCEFSLCSTKTCFEVPWAPDSLSKRKLLMQFFFQRESLVPKVIFVTEMESCFLGRLNQKFPLVCLFFKSFLIYTSGTLGHSLLIVHCPRSTTARSLRSKSPCPSSTEPKWECALFTKIQMQLRTGILNNV